MAVYWSPPQVPIIEFLDLPWWSRVWLKQEVAVTTSSEYACGHSRLGWRHARTSVLTLAQYSAERLAPRLHEDARYLAWMAAIRTVTLNLLESLSRKPSSLLRLFQVLGRSPFGEATDPRNRIHAIVGIADYPLGLTPKYEISADISYCLFAKAQIRTHANHTRRLSILWLSCHQKGCSTDIRGLSSWAP